MFLILTPQSSWHSQCLIWWQEYIFRLEPGNEDSGKGKCPYDPKLNSVSALISEYHHRVYRFFHFKCIKCILVNLSLWFSANKMIKTNVPLPSQWSSFLKFLWINIALCLMFYCWSVAREFWMVIFPSASSAAVFLMRPGGLLPTWIWRWRKKKEGSFVSICCTFYRNDPFCGVPVTHNWKFRS